MSIIEQNITRATMRESITNALGLPGAVIASWLIDSMFGILIALPILLLGTYAIHIIFPFVTKGWKLLFCTLFILIWGSIALVF